MRPTMVTSAKGDDALGRRVLGHTGRSHEEQCPGDAPGALTALCPQVRLLAANFPIPRAGRSFGSRFGGGGLADAEPAGADDAPGRRRLSVARLEMACFCLAH